LRAQNVKTLVQINGRWGEGEKGRRGEGEKKPSRTPPEITGAATRGRRAMPDPPTCKAWSNYRALDPVRQ
jgi:hypothetical protein